MTNKILIVEDDVDIRRNLVHLLSREGYSVESAEDGKVALEKLRVASDLPGLILLDLMMPVMDGFEFWKHQQNDPKLHSIPIAIMTAGSHMDEKISQMKPSVVLKKPTELMEILTTVESLVRPLY